MQTTESVKRRIRSALDLQSVVKTMKSLAAANIRQYERAVDALQVYARTIERGLQVVLGQTAKTAVRAREAQNEPLTIIIVGSDLGMCGQLNEQIVAYCLDSLGETGLEMNSVTALVIGQRVAGKLEEQALSLERVFSVPGGLSEITPVVQDLIESLDQLRIDGRLKQVRVYYNEHTAKASFRPRSVRLLPMDRRWLRELKSREWPGTSLPTFTMERHVLLSYLIRQYLFVSLYRGLVESLASENSTRLVTMQSGERNIKERLGELTNRYHQLRQTAITSEILEIVAGFDALQTREEEAPQF